MSGISGDRGYLVGLTVAAAQWADSFDVFSSEAHRAFDNLLEIEWEEAQSEVAKAATEALPSRVHKKRIREVSTQLYSRKSEHPRWSRSVPPEANVLSCGQALDEITVDQRGQDVQR